MSSRRLVFELAKSDDDVGDLDAGVVDVVLHLDGNAAEALHAYERVAQRGIAKVADVRRLVRVDGGVLDDRLSAVDRRRSSDLSMGGQTPMARLSRRRRRDPDRCSGSRSARPRRARCRRGPERRGELLRDARGALRRRRASSKATGVARSPSSRFGGYSIGSCGSASGGS